MSVTRLGDAAGFVAGWTLLLTYLAYAGGVSALVGSFLQAAMQNCGLNLASLWVVIGVEAILLAAYCAYRDMRIAARLMLALESLSVLAVLGLSCVIVDKLAFATGLPVAPLLPEAKFDGWSGVGYGLVFTILSFAGFEGAATLGEEVMNPRRNTDRNSGKRHSGGRFLCLRFLCAGDRLRPRPNRDARPCRRAAQQSRDQIRLQGFCDGDRHRRCGQRIRLRHRIAQRCRPSAVCARQRGTNPRHATMPLMTSWKSPRSHRSQIFSQWGEAPPVPCCRAQTTRRPASPAPVSSC